MEDIKRDRFLRVAAKRTEKILDMIELLGNCSNTSNYSFTAEEIHKIFSSIRNELDLQEKKFQAKLREGQGKRKRFKL